jgi:small subunit ribosomal protein S7
MHILLKRREIIMPRKGPVTRRDVLPDPLYNSKLVTRLINRLMLDGKRGVAQNILYNAFNLVQQRSGKEPMEVFEQALKNIMPLLEVRARRVGGANYQVPVEVRPDRRTTLGLRWMVNYSRLRGEKTMEERLAAELLDAANGTGASVKKREDMHKMAEANKAFAHYRW